MTYIALDLMLNYDLPTRFTCLAAAYLKFSLLLLYSEEWSSLSYPYIIRLWNATTRTAWGSHGAPAGLTWGWAFSPDSKLIGSGPMREL
jgi:hypothetical protein